MQTVAHCCLIAGVAALGCFGVNQVPIDQRAKTALMLGLCAVALIFVARQAGL